jgi:hypothetical protein
MLGRILLLGLAAATVATACRAEDPRFRKALTETSEACPAYGEGFVRVHGSDTCVKVSGRVIYEYEYQQR